MLVQYICTLCGNPTNMYCTVCTMCMHCTVQCVSILLFKKSLLYIYIQFYSLLKTSVQFIQPINSIAKMLLKYQPMAAKMLN